MGFFFIKADDELGELAALEGAPVIGLDLETAGSNPFSPHQSRIRLMQLASQQDTFVIDLDRVDPRERVAPLLTANDSVKVIHHAKFDVKHLLHHFQIEVGNLFCSMLASKLLAMGKRARHGLSEVVLRYLGRKIDKELQRSDFSGSLSEAQIQYAATDAEVLVPLYTAMSEQIKNHKLQRVSQLEFRTVVPVAAMELRGIYLDVAALEVITDRLQAQSRQLENEVLAELRCADDLPGMSTLNLNAPDQVKQALADKGIHVTDTTDARLRPLAETHPFIENLLQYRHVAKIIGATLRPFKSSVLPETGRIHATYHQIASASGRFACADPNIQQVPREREVRACFKPEPGYRYVIADYSQVELRVAAGLSQDPIMIEAYRDGGDLHRLTAALTMGKPIEEVSGEERQAAKAINFGLIYAMGARGLQQSAQASYGVHMNMAQAVKFRNRYFENYRGIQRWQQEMERVGKMRGYVRTAAGRIRSYVNEDIRVTELYNTPVQGTAAEGLKSAMCIFWDRVKKDGLDAAVVAIIHDEIIVEVRADQAEQAKVALEESMVSGISWLVPDVIFAADGVIADSWADK